MKEHEALVFAEIELPPPDIFERYSMLEIEQIIEGARKRHERFVSAVAWLAMETVNISGKTVKQDYSFSAMRQIARKALPFQEPPGVEKPVEQLAAEEAERLQHTPADSKTLAFMETLAERGLAKKTTGA